MGREVGGENLCDLLGARKKGLQQMVWYRAGDGTKELDLKGRKER